MDPNEVVITTHLGRAVSISVNGVDFSGMVQGYTVSQAAGKAPAITLMLTPSRIRFDEEVEDA